MRGQDGSGGSGNTEEGLVLLGNKASAPREQRGRAGEFSGEGGVGWDASAEADDDSPCV